MKKLWEILVPCTIQGRKVRRKHHQRWDRNVHRITGGLTIYKPAKGIWAKERDGCWGDTHQERMIPVRIFCTEEQINKICDFTAKHYKQYAVMYYLVTDNIQIVQYENIISKRVEKK